MHFLSVVDCCVGSNHPTYYVSSWGPEGWNVVITKQIYYKDPNYMSIHF